MRVGGQRHALTALPPGKTQYPLYRRLGGPQSRSGQVRKISPTPGFDPRTVQPVASRYAGSIYIYIYIYIHVLFWGLKSCILMPEECLQTETCSVY